MWQSPSGENPWRVFRRNHANHQRPFHDENIPRNRQTTRKYSARVLADDKTSTHYIERGEREDDSYTHFDDNVNANIFDKFIFYGQRRVPMCDKQTQTDLTEEKPDEQELRPLLTSQRVLYSKSCESLVRKSRINPRASRSFDLSNNTCTNVSEKFNQDDCKLQSTDFKNREESSPIKPLEISPFPTGQSMTGGFYVQKYPHYSPSEHEEMSQNQVHDNGIYEIPKQMEQIHINSYWGEEFVSDTKSESKHKAYEERTGESYGNQWSPFHHVRERNPMFYDYRQPDEVSLISERSCYSTTSEEADDDYEIVDWDQYTDDYNEEERNRKRKSDAFNTPSTTPILDLSALDGYHTAPNSPDDNNVQEHSYLDEKHSRRYFVADNSSNYSNNYRKSDEKRKSQDKDHVLTGSDVPRYDVVNDNVQGGTIQCCKCGKPTEDCQANHSDVREYDLITRHEQQRRNQRVSATDSKTLCLETPPFISVNSLHYEADPETGKAKVIGRGSFGLVYKARFSDPMFSHLPIVIKEFDEEFTNSKEILEEAKRLHYLQDTGFVPICYGLLCFGSPIQPKYGIVQEYVGTGLTLEQMLWDQYELPLEFWFRIVIQCCEGLARFHQKGILLNDIKTNNILLEFGEHSVRIRYIDFGLATDMRGKRYKNTKSLNDFVYLAPEVRRNGRVTNIASDIYSLGYILEQIKIYTGVHELTVVARLCMDRNPDMRIPPRAAASMIKDHMIKLGFDPLIVRDL